MQDPLDAARQRLARGDITPDEYDAIAGRLSKPTDRGWPGLPMVSLVIGLGAAVAFGVGALIVPQVMAQYLIVIAIIAIVAIVAIAFLYLMGG